MQTFLKSLIVALFAVAIHAQTDKTTNGKEVDPGKRGRYAEQFSGSDIGAKINAARQDCGTSCTIYIPAGTYSYSTGIILADGITLRGAGTDATILTYTGSGVGIDYNYKTRVQVRELSFVTTSASTGIKVRGVNVVLDNVRVSGASSGKMVWVTGDGSSLQSNWVNLTNVKIGEYDFTGIGLQVDHAVDVTVNAVPIYSATNGTTATNFLVDTGVSGLNVQTCTTGFGLNGLRVQNSSPGAGAYNQSPSYLFFDQFFADTATGGDAIKFDSTLSTSIVAAEFTNSWAAAAGLNNASTVVTTTANGIHISGGDLISFQGSVRLNALNGVLVDNANVKHVNVNGSHILGNNQTNNADAHGIYVSAALIDSAFSNNLIGNTIDSGGHQKYGIKIAALLADQVRILGNDLQGNETAPLLNSSIGNYWQWANLPSGSVANVVWGGVTMAAGASLNMNSNAISGASTGSFSGAITSTLATGAAPFVIASTTPVANLSLSGGTGATIAAMDSIATKQAINTRTNITLANGANNDIALSGATFVKVVGPTGVFSVSGFAGGTDGRILRLYNSVAFAMTITNNATSSAANRILTLTGADVTLRAGQSLATFIYDSSQNLWILAGTN